tara:strand:- start:109 stop:516 length:408 start_codon:yes stop_codon:yes gene_type:complete
MAMTNRFAHFVKTASDLDNRLKRDLSPQVKLSRIMDLIEKAESVNLKLGSPAKSYLIRSEELRAEAIEAMWAIYYNVLKYVRSTEDESWNNRQFNNATGTWESDNVAFWGDGFEDYVGAELHGSNSVTKVVRYDD